MIIRKYQESDFNEIARLFYDTVHTINRKDYSEEQLNVWADGQPDRNKWNSSLLEHLCIVAVIDGQIAGFGDIDKSGYLDRLYVHKDFQGMKVGTVICDSLEQQAQGLTISVHASITALPFFMKRGYQAIKEQQVERRGIMLTNFICEKKTKKLH